MYICILYNVYYFKYFILRAQFEAAAAVQGNKRAHTSIYKKNRTSHRLKGYSKIMAK